MTQNNTMTAGFRLETGGVFGASGFERMKVKKRNFFKKIC